MKSPKMLVCVHVVHVHVGVCGVTGVTFLVNL